MKRKSPIVIDPDILEQVIPDRRKFCTEGYWSDDRLGDLVRDFARVQPDTEAVVDRLGRRRVSYKEFDRLTNRFANWILSQGLEKGDVISVQLPNSLEAAVIIVGANKAGIIVNPMLTVYRAKELRHMLRFIESSMIFTPRTHRDFSFIPLVEQVMSDLEHEIAHVVVDVTDDDAEGSSDWLDGLASYSDAQVETDAQASDISLVLFTSGTESTPKAVLHSEQTLNSNIRSVWESFEMSSHEIVWTPSPVGHSSGINFGIRYALLHGAKLVLQDRWTPAAAISIVERERPTFTLAATIFLSDLLNAAENDGTNLSCLRIFGCGGAPIPAALVEKAASQGINVLRLYGQTETMVASLNRPASSTDKRVQTDGDAVNGYVLEIRDEDNRVVGPGVIGELCVSGPGNSLGYFNDKTRTLKKFKRGTVHTADLAVMDGDGHITIIGRISDIIIRGGLNIMPREIEEAIRQMKGIEDIVIVGLPHPRLGEYCCACVVSSAKEPPTLDEICDHLTKVGFAKFKLPQRLEIMQSLPTTASGKIQRHLLVEALSAADGHSLSA